MDKGECAAQIEILSEASLNSDFYDFKVLLNDQKFGYRRVTPKGKMSFIYVRGVLTVRKDPWDTWAR
jgi:hypothetical protein